MARLEGASNHKLEFIENIYLKFRVIKPPSARSFVLTWKKLLNKNTIVNPLNVFYMQQQFPFLVMNLVIKI